MVLERKPKSDMPSALLYLFYDTTLTHANASKTVGARRLVFDGIALLFSRKPIMPAHNLAVSCFPNGT